MLKPDHVRDVDLFVERYGARAFGPWLFWPQNIPKTALEPVQPGTELPGGLVALYDGRGRMETPLWLPEQRALVFADALTAPEGELLVGETPWHEERVLPALRALLDLPFEHVVVSHSNDAPVHDRAAFERPSSARRTRSSSRSARRRRSPGSARGRSGRRARSGR